MAAEIPTRHEVRTRVTYFLPLNDEREEIAVHTITRYLKEQRRRSVAVTGFTHSVFIDPVFIGSWWSKPVGSKRSRWVLESVALFVVDYACSLDDPQLTRAIGRLKKTIERAYADQESIQEEIWIIAQRATRYI